jgi:hypothetical protein
MIKSITIASENPSGDRDSRAVGSVRTLVLVVESDQSAKMASVGRLSVSPRIENGSHDVDVAQNLEQLSVSTDVNSARATRVKILGGSIVHRRADATIAHIRTSLRVAAHKTVMHHEIATVESGSKMVETSSHPRELPKPEFFTPRRGHDQ